MLLTAITSCSTTQENSFPKSDYTSAGIPKLPETAEMKAFKEALKEMSRASAIAQIKGEDGSFAKHEIQPSIISPARAILLANGYSQKELNLDNGDLFRLAVNEYVKQAQNHKIY